MPISADLVPARAEWRREVVNTPFSSKEGHVVVGNEAIIYRRPNLPFVLKKFTRAGAYSGYELALDVLDNLQAKTAFIDGKKINVNGKIESFTGAIQETVRPLENEFKLLVKARNIDALTDLIRRKVQLDKEILHRGVFIQDPELKNCGFSSSGEVVLIDPGEAVTDPWFGGISHHGVRVINRGWTHYSIALRLEDTGEHSLLFFLKNPTQLSDLYKQQTGLTFVDHIRASTHLLIALPFEDFVIFGGKTFGELAEEELDKYFPRRVPHNAQLQELGDASLDGWEPLGNGTWKRI